MHNNGIIAVSIVIRPILKHYSITIINQ